jgi:hypothetical protein
LVICLVLFVFKHDSAWGPGFEVLLGADADGFEKSGQAKVPNSVEINLRGSWRHRNEAPVALDLSGCAEK